MSYYSNYIDVNILVNDSSGNDTNGSITGYQGFPISQSVPDSYNFMRIPNSLGYKKNGVDLAQTSNGNSKCNAYSVFYNQSNQQNIDISNYNYMSCVLVGGGGGGGGGYGNNSSAGGGGGGGAGAYYRVDISSFNNLLTKGGFGGDGGNSGSNDSNTSGNAGNASYIYLGNSASYRILANGGNGGIGNYYPNNSSPDRGSGGNSGNFGTNNITTGTLYSFNGKIEEYTG